MFVAQQSSGQLVHFTLAPLMEDHGFALAAMGIFVVFIALTLVVAFITILPHFVKWISAKQQQPVSETPVAAPSELSEETVAIIAAAVSEVIRQPHRIVQIRGLREGNLGWSLEGRMEHHHSHKITNPNRR